MVSAGILAMMSHMRPQSTQSASARAKSYGNPAECVRACLMVMVDFLRCANSGQYFATGASISTTLASINLHIVAATSALPHEKALNSGGCWSSNIAISLLTIRLGDPDVKSKTFLPAT